MIYKATRNIENLNKRIFQGVGPYDIPEIRAVKFEPCEFIGFNYAASAKERAEKGVHFFLDDYQFERVWNNAEKYLAMLSEFKYVMTPDFSTYTDYPKAIQIYNHIVNIGLVPITRKMALTSFQQFHGAHRIHMNGVLMVSRLVARWQFQV